MNNVVSRASKKKTTGRVLPPGVQERANGSFVVRWREDGVQRAESFENRLDAIARNAEVRLAKVKGRKTGGPAEGRTILVGQWWDRFCASRMGGGSPWTNGTAACYRQTRDRLQSAGLLDGKLAALTREQITSWQGAMRAEGLSEQTIRCHTARFSTVVQGACEDGLIAGNVLAHKQVRARRSVVKANQAIDIDELPSTEDVAGLRASLAPRLRVAVLLAGELGLRSGEVRAVKVGDVVVRKGSGVLKVQRQMVRLRGAEAAGSREVERGCKHGSEREIPLTDDQLARLREHVREFTDRQPGSYLLQSSLSAGKALDAHSFSVAIERAAVRSGVAGAGLLHPHALRHFAASSWLEQGISALEVAKSLGNTLEVTMATYLHITENAPDRLRAVMAAQSAALAAAAPRPALRVA